jgi:hypothetical protein
MIKKIHLLILIFLSINTIAQVDPLKTFYEESDCKATPTYEETIAYCKKLDSASVNIFYTTFGKTPQGRDLPLLIIDSDGFTNPYDARSKGKLVVLIEAGIHSGEIDGKDAGLMFFRDIAVKGMFGGIPKNITFLFIPIFNVDGHERFGPYNRINQVGPEEMGWRTTAQNLNLNRDFLKADAPEMKAWLNNFRFWKPDFFVDIHVTDGADYQYVMTYGLETYGNMDEGLTNWTREQFIPAMEKDMDKAGYPSFPYIMFRQWHDPRSGLRSTVSGPKLSQGYTATRNRIGLLVENHSLKDYKTRVSCTYELLKFLDNFLSENATKLIGLNTEADKNTASETFLSKPFAVDYKAAPDSVIIDFKGVEYDTETSDLTGGDWFKYHPDKPVTFKVPYFNHQVPAVEIIFPQAYIIPPEWGFVKDKLVLHGIKFEILDKPQKITVESYKFTQVQYGTSSYEGHLQVKPTFDTYIEEREYPAGSVVVSVRQPSARLIAHMFEPASPDSYLQWGFFNSIFEMKEYFESYQMEEYARKMIKDDPDILTEFEKWKSDNPETAKNQWAELEWFYMRSPWADKKLNVYPVGRILEKSVLDKLLER